MNDLSIAESTDLSHLESVVERTKDAAAEFYEALHQIRSRRLYREQYKTWDEYCEKRWKKSPRALTTGIDAHKIRKQIGNTVAEITNRTALALKNVKPKLRQKVFQKAQELAGSKPVSPTHIAKSTTRREITIHNLADMYAPTTPRHQLPPRAAAPAPESTHAVTLPQIAEHAALFTSFIEALYERDKAWFNDISPGRPRSPRQVIDKIISELRNAA